MFPSKKWDTELPNMLQSQEPESAHLDYKAREALIPPGKGGGGIDRQKRAEDISKDVSSFLNSDGGVLVYGIREDPSIKTTGGAPIPWASFDPTKDGYLRSEITKETIENLITSNIDPPPDARLYHVAEVEIMGKIVFVVEVALGSGTAYQAKDLRYYQRSHYKSEPMEHYQIEMVRARRAAPVLEAVAGLTTTWEREGRIDVRTSIPSTERRDIGVQLGIRNFSEAVAEVALIEVGLFSSHMQSPPTPMLRAEKRNIHYVIGEGRHTGIAVNEEIEWFQLPWNPSARGERYQPLFNLLEPIWVSQLGFKMTLSSDGPLVWCWRIQSPGMPPQSKLMGLEFRMPNTLRVRELDWEFTVDVLS